MCGISGFCNFGRDFTASDQLAEESRDTLRQMRRSIAHRGCDQTGEFLRSHVGLSHTRLSIRDLSNGRQPMLCSSEGFEYAIVFNGEIYNTAELEAGLLAAGHSLKTSCDTEVILKAYIEYGPGCVDYLNGIFAFAIWDGRENRLMLARDRLGVKPLFYAWQDGTLIFGSEIKALFAYPGLEPQLDLDSFREVFGIGPARTHGCGVFRGISELQPGYFALLDESGLQMTKYWDLSCREHHDSYEQTVERVHYLLSDAIQLQMISDVPVCSFLSGGVDSSIVTAIAADILKKNGGKLNTYSFDFAGNDQYFTANAFQPERDLRYVDMMLSHIDVNHSYLLCDESMLVGLLREAMLAKDLPGMADVDASLLYFCKLVKLQNKVALTGECADEIFGGYPWFYREDLLGIDGFPWSSDMSMRTCLLQDDFIRRLDLDSYVRSRYLDSLAQVPVLDGESQSDAKLRQISYLNIKWFMQTLLDRMDRTSMYSGLEARVPFADHRIVEYVFNVPWAMKRRDGVEKSLLRDAFRDTLPPELLYRKKSPYPKTYNPNYDALLKKKLCSILHDPNSAIHSIIDVKKTLRFMDEPSELGKPWFGQLMSSPQLLAYIIQIEQWLDTYKPRILF